jgi:Protein of unknown function (DUF4232)
MRTAAVICAVLVVGVAAAPALATRTAAPSRCTTAGLVVWLDTTGNGAAGSSYYKLEFTNQSGHSCSLYGYPGVSAVNLAGSQIGAAGGRTTTTRPRVITLANGATATATLRIVDALNFPNSACRLTNAAGVRVYPPNQTGSKVVPFPFKACSRRGSVILYVYPVT